MIKSFVLLDNTVETMSHWYTLPSAENIQGTVLPAKSDSDVVLCLQSYQGLIIDGSLVY